MFLSLPRWRDEAMSSSEGREQLMIFSAEQITCCRDFLSTAVLSAYHTIRQ